MSMTSMTPRTLGRMLGRTLGGAAVAGALALAAGCGESGGEGGAAANGSTSGTPEWRLASMPESAVAVGEAKKTLKEGDEVAVRGVIGGSREPVGKEAAYFTIVDTSIPSCADMEGDHCPTPWDYCCEPGESLKANQATVKVVDAGGKIMPIDLTKFDVKPNSEVVVVGRVAPRATEDVLTIEATGVHVIGG